MARPRRDDKRNAIMDAAALEGWSSRAKLRGQCQRMWSNWTRWAVEWPGRRRALDQLSVSEDLRPATRTASHQTMAPPSRSSAPGEVPMSTQPQNTAARPVYVITGPTSGIGHRTALELAQHGKLILVGRDTRKLAEVEQELSQRGLEAVTVVCDLSEPVSIRRAVAEIIALQLPIAGVLNNAGVRQEKATRNSLGWDVTFATNHLGTFLFTELLLPHLPDGATVINIASAVEDPERKPAVMAGFRGGRLISVEAGSRGQWEPGGSTKAGFDSYATSKQAILAATLALARQNPRLRINALEPGFIANTGLGRDAPLFLRLIANLLTPVLPLLIPGASTMKRAARVATEAVVNPSGQTGIYIAERGQPMQASRGTQDLAFQDRVATETRELLAKLPS